MKGPGLPAIKRVAEAAAYREQLEAWLRHWHIDRCLQPQDGAGAREGGFLDRGLSNRASPLQAGDVRLLRPDRPSTRAGLRYVMVLDTAGSGRALAIVPFSRFPVPALPGEWRTDHESPSLRVLCCWNARRAPRTWIEQSWPVTTMSPDAVESTREICAHPADPAAEPSPSMADRVGPPLRHPADPRHEYIEEECRVGDEWGEPLGEVQDRFRWLLRDGGGSRLPLAAEEPPPYGSERHGDAPVDRPPDSPPSGATGSP